MVKPPKASLEALQKVYACEDGVQRSTERGNTQNNLYQRCTTASIAKTQETWQIHAFPWPKNCPGTVVGRVQRVGGEVMGHCRTVDRKSVV